MRLIKAFFRSILLTLFIAVVCSAIITVVVIPQIGTIVAAPRCNGTVESQTSSFSQANGEFGTTISYQCVSESGEAKDIPIFDLLKQVAIYYLAVMLLIIWPSLFLLSYIRNGKNIQTVKTISISAP